MKIPIVLTAFGTTTKAKKTYDHIQAMIEAEFPGHQVLRAYSSRMVRSRIASRDRRQIPDPAGVLEQLHREGHKWAVVQSLHLICGHEFYRLVDEARQAPIRTSIGLPLLTSYGDHLSLARAMGEEKKDFRQAVVLVGHGTDHPAWTTYLAFEKILRRQAGKHFHLGMVEGLPDRQQTIDQVLESGATRVCLIPFMLVAGVHFQEDLLEGEDSWKAAFEKAGLEVSLVPDGLGLNPAVGEIFCDHVRRALEVIPGG